MSNVTGPRDAAAGKRRQAAALHKRRQADALQRPKSRVHQKKETTK